MYNRLLTAIVALSVFVLVSGHAHAFDCSEVNINSFMNETQLMNEGQDRLLLIWWIPIEYWCVSTSGDPSVTEEDLKQFDDILQDYTLIAVVDGTMGALGSVTFKTDKEVLPLLTLRDSKGNEYKPLGQDDINPETQAFLSILKPILANMMGDMGQNMHFIVFNSSGKDGNRIDDPVSTGTLTAVYDKEDYAWRLPLDSMLAKKPCPKCGGECPGSWSYCPYDGTKL